MPPARHPSGEAGFALIEIVVSAALLVVIALGVFAQIDGSQAASGENRSKSVAAALAQQDQERMHAMRTADLSNYQAIRTVTVAGIPYTVSSRADWVTDSSGSVSCTNGSTAADYIKITSAVRWPAIGVFRPVTLEGLVAVAPGALAPRDGNLSVQLEDQTASPVRDIPVTLSGPVNETLSTNAAGCAFFGQLPAGSYQASYSAPGYVDASGANAITLPASVSSSTTNVITQTYALAANVAVSFVTPVGQAQQPAQAQSISVENPNLPSPGTRTFGGGSAQSTITATGLFPFSAGYGIYAGGCSTANPVSYDPNYFTKNPGLVAVAPGGALAVTVLEPALNLAVSRAGVALSGANVRVTPVGCGDVYPVVTTGPQGSLGAPGYPFGTYTVCADDGVHRVLAANVANTTPSGTAPIPLSIPTTGTAGVC